MRGIVPRRQRVGKSEQRRARLEAPRVNLARE
jgi:hypothetical protein